MTSKGYVKKTEVIPAIDPERKRRTGVSCSGEVMMTERICS